MTSVYVQVPAYEEAHKLPKTLRAVNEQPVPEGYSLTKEAWVTRSEDRRGVCTTWQAGKTVGGWTVKEAPQGKLSARNAAHNHATESGADIIVQWDADAPPTNDDTLTRLLETVSNSNVAAANSVTTSQDGSVWGAINHLASRAEDAARPHVHGQCHAMTSEAWRVAGPFDTDLDETNIADVRAEEEFAFHDRLAEVGAVVEAPGATVFNDPRRSKCALPGLEDREFCERIGEDTF